MESLYSAVNIVSSRGLIMTTDIHSPHPKSSDDGDEEYLQNIEQHENMSIYVCSHMLRKFVNKYLSKIHYKFYLVSGDSDLEVPREALSSSEFSQLLGNKFLVKWYAQNLKMYSSMPKIENLPIGLDYHTIADNPEHWWRMHTENPLPRGQETLLLKISREAHKLRERQCKIWSNVHFRMDRWGQRERAINTIPKDLLVKEERHLNRGQCWTQTTKYAFVLSPFGNGFDCHRTYETLCLGSIPIINAPHFKHLFEGLTILNVDEWADVTQELLERTQLEFSLRTWDWEKLTLSYWSSKWKNHFCDRHDG